MRARVAIFNPHITTLVLQSSYYCMYLRRSLQQLKLQQYMLILHIQSETLFWKFGALFCNFSRELSMHMKFSQEMHLF